MISQTSETSSDVERRDVPIGAVRFNPQNVRELIGPAELGRLVDSLKINGLLAPIGVRTAGDGSFTLIYGERRLRAAEVAGWPSIPANVHECDDAAAVLMMVEENMQRKKLNLIETARALKLLATPIEQGGAGLRQHEIGARFGHQKGWVSNMIRLLRLPEVWQRRVARGELCSRKARLLFPHVDRLEVLERMDDTLRSQPANCRTAVQFEYRLREHVAAVDGTPPPQIPDDISERHARNVRKIQLDKARGVALRIMADAPAAEDLIAGDGEREGGKERGGDGGEKSQILIDVIHRVARIDDVAHLDATKAAVELRRGELQRV